MNLPDYLTKIEPELAKVIAAFAEAVKQIDQVIRTAETTSAGSFNTSGDEQLKLDILSDRIVFAELEKSGVVSVAASEEQSEEKVLTKGGPFSAAFDPLDGSSLVDVNLAVGTIFGIWPGAGFIGKSGKEMLAAGYAIYGPRTTFTVAVDTNPVEFTLQQDGTFKMTIEKLEIGEGKMFAPGNLRACHENKEYLSLLDFWAENGYQLRYSGGMVPDIHQILVKGKGVFSYPGSESCPPKLRLLYECAPLSFVIEKAGGASSDLTQSVLEKKVEELDQRSVVCVGSKDEVDRFEKFLTV